ncbi:13648_t:CDS:2 [Dentiscutata erythropus]|uniref:13648_t:CDS:1 n=1 Tax=Dentiscutata erythropus TaxID=1348616 RepID=A0A9N8W1F9_9GLOM|nr:13648_t:CDS:2 [Dentiscutata erythropus]
MSKIEFFAISLFLWISCIDGLAAANHVMTVTERVTNFVTMYIPATAKSPPFGVSQQKMTQIASNHKVLPSSPRVESVSPILNIQTTSIEVISNPATPIVSATEIPTGTTGIIPATSVDTIKTIPAISADTIKIISTATSAPIEATTPSPINTIATDPFTSIATDTAKFTTLKPSTLIQSTSIQTMTTASATIQMITTPATTNTLQRTPLTNSAVSATIQKSPSITSTATSKVISALRTHSTNNQHPTNTIASVNRPSSAIGNTLMIESMMFWSLLVAIAISIFVFGMV